jgi:hypothetical protein
MVQVGSLKKYRKMFLKKIISYLVCSQIWLDLPLTLWLQHKIEQKKGLGVYLLFHDRDGKKVEAHC